MWRIAIVALLAACSQETAPVAEAPAAKPTGKGGGFSADLAKQIGSNLGGSATPTDDGSAKSEVVSAEPVQKPEAGSAGSATGSAKPETGKPEAGSAKGSAAKVEPAAGSAKPPVAAAGSAKPPVAAAGSAKPPVAAAGSAKPPPVATTANTNAPLSRDRVKPPAELAAIKISLLPNWERDIGEAGTLSFPVKLPSGTVRVFVFRYGIEDTAAPADRDAYKKWLADTKRLSVASDRQRGAAWTLEGSDGSGAGAFRYLINFGGKKLICYGSLYKDAESSKLGDLRDQAILQAKQICETLAL